MRRYTFDLWVSPNNLICLIIDLGILFTSILTVSIASRYVSERYISNINLIILSQYLIVEIALLFIVVVVSYPLRYGILKSFKIPNLNLNYYLDTYVIYIGILGVVYSSSIGTMKNSIIATIAIFVLSVLSGYDNQDLNHPKSKKNPLSFEQHSSCESLSDSDLLE